MKNLLLLVPQLVLFCLGCTQTPPNQVTVNAGTSSSNLTAAASPTPSPGSSAAKTEFRITSPASNSLIDSEVIEVSGTGATAGAKITVSVFTDQWYVQDGTADISADGHWTFGPVYLKGKGQFNKHRIKAQMVAKGRTQSTEVENVRRR